MRWPEVVDRRGATMSAVLYVVGLVCAFMAADPAGAGCGQHGGSVVLILGAETTLLPGPPCQVVGTGAGVAAGAWGQRPTVQAGPAGWHGWLPPRHQRRCGSRNAAKVMTASPSQPKEIRP